MKNKHVFALKIPESVVQKLVRSPRLIEHGVKEGLIVLGPFRVGVAIFDAVRKVAAGFEVPH